MQHRTTLGLTITLTIAISTPPTAAESASEDKPGSAGIRQVAVGQDHTLIVKDDGTVWAWGANQYGQLGDGTTTDRTEPVQAKGLSNIIGIAAGAHHSIAFDADGAIWAWGRNARGQLGDGSQTDRTEPTRVDGFDGSRPENASPQSNAQPEPKPDLLGQVEVDEVARVEQSGQYQVAISPEGWYLLVGNENRNAVSFCRSDGKVFWQYKLPESIEMESGALAFNGDMIVVGGQGGGVYMLSRIGDLLWSDPDLGGECQVAVADKIMRVFAAGSRTLRCYKRDGTIVWTKEIDTEEWAIRGLDVMPDGRTVFIRTNSDVILCDRDGNRTALHDIVEGNHLFAGDLSDCGDYFAVGYSRAGEDESEQQSHVIGLYSREGNLIWEREVADFADIAVDDRLRVFATVRSDHNYLWNKQGQLCARWPSAGLKIAVSQYGGRCIVGRASGHQSSIFELFYPAEWRPDGSIVLGPHAYIPKSLSRSRHSRRGDNSDKTDSPKLKVGDPAPPLHIAEWIKGEPVDLNAGKGKQVYVIEFWATWCGPCIQSIPHLTELQHRYKDDGVVIVSISDEKPNELRSFVTQRGDKMDFTIAADRNGATQKAWLEAVGHNGIPHAFVVGTDGTVAWHGHPNRGLEDAIRQALGVQEGNEDESDKVTPAPSCRGPVLSKKLLEAAKNRRRKPLSEQESRYDPNVVTEHVVSITADDFAPAPSPAGHFSPSAAISLQSERPRSVQIEPQYKGRKQLYGRFNLGIGPKTWYHFSLDLLDDGVVQMYFDKNQNRCLTDDGGPIDNAGTGVFGARVSLPMKQIMPKTQFDSDYTIWVFTNDCFWPHKKMTFYSRTCFKGTIELDGETYPAYLSDRGANDADLTNDGIYIDFDRDGRFDRTEWFASDQIVDVLGKPCIFSITQ